MLRKLVIAALVFYLIMVLAAFHLGVDMTVFNLVTLIVISAALFLRKRV